MVVLISTTRMPGSSRSPVRRSSRSTMVASAGRSPRPRWSVGYQASSVWPSAVTVARPSPHAVVVRYAVTAGHATESAVARSGRSDVAGRTIRAVRPTRLQARGLVASLVAVTAHLDAAMLADPVELTRALVDIESVSGNEAEIADAVEAALRQRRAPDVSTGSATPSIARTDSSGAPSGWCWPATSTRSRSPTTSRAVPSATSCRAAGRRT